jgi:hypothetical protein
MNAMNPLPSGIPSQHYTTSVNSARPLEASGSQAQYSHFDSISPVQLSHKATLALNQVANPPNLNHQDGPAATAATINAHLHNTDGSLRTQSQVAGALRAAGWGAGPRRIAAQLQAAGGGTAPARRHE